MSVRAEGDLVPQSRRVVPLEICGFVVGINIELASESQLIVGFVIVLMAFHVSKFGRKREV
jgi:hypothetical protein